MENDNKTKLDWALYYQSIGLNIIPVGKNKVSLIKWEEYQNRCSTIDEIKNWWGQWPEANIALVTGRVSGVVALDIDKKNNRSSKEFTIPPTICAKSGGGGEHFFFKYPQNHSIKSGSAISGEGVDCRGDKGYILLSPSVNETGGMYEWILPFESKNDLADMPEWFIKLVTEEEKEKKWLLGKDGVPKGLRNDTATSLAGKILSSTDPELWESIGWDQLVVWNQKNEKPLDGKELRGIWESIRNKHFKDSLNKEGPEKGSQADKLIEILESSTNVTLFHDEFKQPHISIPINNHFETWKCTSSQLKNWLSKTYWDKHKKAPNSDALNTALTVIKGKASFEGEEINLHNRVAWSDGVLWYDLANSDWKTIKITEEGWAITDPSPIIFRRYTHQRAQAIPQRGGNVKDILKFVNITDGDHQILFLVWIVSCFLPDFPHPVPYIYGPQGSAKSTVSKISREIVDPSLLEVVSFPKNDAELIQVLFHNCLVFFDNVSLISDGISDTLCKAVTGGGFSKRELYTDDEDVIYNFKRSIGINGINLTATRPDLLQRSILFELSAIPEGNKREEGEMWAEFNLSKPAIIGAIFDALVKAIKIKKSLKLTKLPRMADFATWGCAIAEAIGYTQNEFLEAYNRNISSQDKEILYENPVAVLIDQLMADKTLWEGTASKLLEELNFLLPSNSPKVLPKMPNHLSQELNRIKGNLEKANIKVTRKDGSQRVITIEKFPDGIPTENKPTEQVELGLTENDKNDAF